MYYLLKYYYPSNSYSPYSSYTPINATREYFIEDQKFNIDHTNGQILILEGVLRKTLTTVEYGELVKGIILPIASCEMQAITEVPAWVNIYVGEAKMIDLKDRERMYREVNDLHKNQKKSWWQRIFG